MLEELNNKNKLLELAMFLQKKYGRDKLAPFNMYYRSFRMTQLFLTEIWDRILKDVQLDNEYWAIQAEIHDAAPEEYELSHEEAQILKEYSEHSHRLNLDVEDWFLHAHILMEKYVKLSKILMVLTSKDKAAAKLANGLPDRSFHNHMDQFLNPNKKGMKDDKYAEVVKLCDSWYESDLKDVRDDLIQHEQVGRFWGHSITPNEFRISRFRYTRRMLEKLYALRDKYAKVYTALEGEQNFFALIDFFEANFAKLDKGDKDRIKGIRKEYGKDFPDIPQLYSKMNHFFSLANDYFISKKK